MHERRYDAVRRLLLNSGRSCTVGTPLHRRSCRPAHRRRHCRRAAATRRAGPTALMRCRCCGLVCVRPLCRVCRHVCASEWMLALVTQKVLWARSGPRADRSSPLIGSRECATCRVVDHRRLRQASSTRTCRSTGWPFKRREGQAASGGSGSMQRSTEQHTSAVFDCSLVHAYRSTMCTLARQFADEDSACSCTWAD